MNPTKKAVEDFRTLSKGFRAVIELADAMDKIGDLQQAESELRVSVDNLRAEHAKQIDKNASLKSEGQALADKLKADARAEADRIATEAKASAEKMATDAKANAARVVEKAEAKRKQLEDATASAEANLEALRKHQADLQTKCVDLESRLEKARASAQQFLGG